MATKKVFVANHKRPSEVRRTFEKLLTQSLNLSGQGLPSKGTSFDWSQVRSAWIFGHNGLPLKAIRCYTLEISSPNDGSASVVNKLLTGINPEQTSHNLLPIKDPELVFGLVGPIGVDIDGVVKDLIRSLADVGYKHQLIHITDEMEDERISQIVDRSSYFKKYETLISYANDFRELAGNKAALAGLAVLNIRDRRRSVTSNENDPALGTAYIVRQFKRPEEIDLMRRVYGRKFVQLSIYGDIDKRRQLIISKIKKYDASPKSDTECEKQAIELIDRDYNEKDNENGQRLSDVFHLGDVFVDSMDRKGRKGTIGRFVNAIFGFNGCSPNKDEYGLYIASAAALRSIDLSRQVGAALFSSKGEVVTLGCNEVPKGGGGTYWYDEKLSPVRDFELGEDPNQGRRSEILFDLVERLKDSQVLSREIMGLSSVGEMVDAVVSRPAVKESQIMDILEFGRIIHAEMSAISDAARLGRKTKGSTLFCTTFPCHMCAKHIVAAGIARVVFLEPYPKSYAEKLHSDAITFKFAEKSHKVLFQPFIGISPRRYRDIFEKKKRKDGLGIATEWYEGSPQPLIEDRSPAYIQNEQPWAYSALLKLRPESGANALFSMPES